MAGGIAPPRNVIYVDRKNSQIPLAGIANVPYTDVILSFLYPDENFNLQLSGPIFDDNLTFNIQTLQDAGRNVLISFGGALDTEDCDDLLAQAYLYWEGGSNISGLVTQIVNIVVQYGFDGIDIDYEDNRGFTGTYDGVAFLSQLTSSLCDQLPGRIITHAPQVAYWDGSGHEFQWVTNPIAPYAKLWQQVGNYITWFNNQFYNTRHYDENAATKVEWYNSIVALTGDIDRPHHKERVSQFYNQG
jgi:chitinase